MLFVGQSRPGDPSGSTGPIFGRSTGLVLQYWSHQNSALETSSRPVSRRPPQRVFRLFVHSLDLDLGCAGCKAHCPGPSQVIDLQLCFEYMVSAPELLTGCSALLDFLCLFSPQPFPPTQPMRGRMLGGQEGGEVRLGSEGPRIIKSMYR